MGTGVIGLVSIVILARLADHAITGQSSPSVGSTVVVSISYLGVWPDDTNMLTTNRSRNQFMEPCLRGNLLVDTRYVEHRSNMRTIYRLPHRLRDPLSPVLRLRFDGR